MKKSYKNPTTKIVQIALARMITTSGFEGTLGTTGGAGSEALSRRGSRYWDDEDEDDY